MFLVVWLPASLHLHGQSLQFLFFLTFLYLLFVLKISGTVVTIQGGFGLKFKYQKLISLRAYNIQLLRTGMDSSLVTPIPTLLRQHLPSPGC